MRRVIATVAAVLAAATMTVGITASAASADSGSNGPIGCCRH
jgi:hypothetical protein